jgi:hypothetical protein
MKQIVTGDGLKPVFSNNEKVLIYFCGFLNHAVLLIWGYII